MRQVNVSGHSMETNRPVILAVKFNDEGKLLNSRLVATSSMIGWGEWQTSRKVPCSFGDLWACTTAGHGGFILVTQTFYHTDEGNPRPWFKAPMLKVEHQFGNVYVYEFEEDCDWAILVYQDEKVLEAETNYYNSRANARSQGLEVSLTTKEFLEKFVLPTVQHYAKWILPTAA